MNVPPAKTQISLGIRPVWSESSLCAQWVAKKTRFLHADSEYSDRTGWMPRLIWVSAGCTCYFAGFVLRWLINVGSGSHENKSGDTMFAILFCLWLLIYTHIWKNGYFQIQTWNHFWNLGWNDWNLLPRTTSSYLIMLLSVILTQTQNNCFFFFFFFFCFFFFFFFFLWGGGVREGRGRGVGVKEKLRRCIQAFSVLISFICQYKTSVVRLHKYDGWMDGYFIYRRSTLKGHIASNNFYIIWWFYLMWN